jgi:CIC family chloride channel protein
MSNEPAKPPDTVSVETRVATDTLKGIAEQEDRIPQRPLAWLALMVLAAVVGAATGLVGAAFRWCLIHLDHVRDHLVVFAHAQQHPAFAWIIPVAPCALGAGVGLYLTQRLSPHTAGSGVPRVEAVLRNHLRPAESWILPVKFIGGALSIGSGLALGREGPTVQMGGTIGRLFGDTAKRFVPEPWTLIAAGAGAGLAVAFNAPLAATLFVVEELLHRFSARVFSATLVATIAGTVVLRALLGNGQDLGSPRLTELPAKVLFGYLLLGLISGLAGVVFNRSLLASLRIADRARNWPRGTKGALVGACAGLIAWFAPQAAGGGDALAQTAVLSRLAWLSIGAFLGIRFILTLCSYASGAPGGIFAPLLALGALLGNGYASLESAVFHQPRDPALYAIVAMAALFTSVVRSPLTGVVLLLEMTGSWTLILPMMAASVTAYSVPEVLGVEPIYDSLRQRDEAAEHADQPSDTATQPSQ